MASKFMASNIMVSKFMAPKFMAPKFMAPKFMANAAFEARLLLRPSHQRTVWTVNKLKCPIPGRPTLPPILSSRSYSDSASTSTPPSPESSGSTSTPPLLKSFGSTSAPPLPKSSGSTSAPPFPQSSGSTSTPPLPKSSGSTGGSQSSGPEDKNSPHSKNWGKVWSWAKDWGATLGLGSIAFGLLTMATQSVWQDWLQTSQRDRHESTRKSGMYKRLKKGPVFRKKIANVIPRNPLVEEIRKVITPVEEDRLYPVIIGEHGTGKTSLIQLAMKGMDEPKGVVYVDIPVECPKEENVVKNVQKALEWSPDKVIDSKDQASLEEVLEVFSGLFIKYQEQYQKIPVLIIDNANRLAETQPRLLDLFQDYAKHAADNGIVTVVFVSSEGRVPPRMMERSSWSRRGRILEINDVSKEEALEYLTLRKINKEQAAQIHELAGGRMVHLVSIVNDIEQGKSTLEAVRTAMFTDAKSQLNSAKVLPDLSYHKEGAKIIRELLEKGSISEKAYYSLVDRVTGRKLLETNVFAFHYYSQEITFQSTAMKRYCEENATDWEPKA